MVRLLVQLRSMQLFNHNAHHLTSGSTFFSDHSAFGDFYGEHEAAYDSVAERLVGMTGPKNLDLAKISASVAEKCKIQMSQDPMALFQTSLKMEKEFCSIIDDYISAKMILQGVPMTEGTRQMLGDLYDKSEVRQYKIQQRLKK